MKYTGIAFPFSFGSTGGVVRSISDVSSTDHIAESIAQILATQEDEREFESYGSLLYTVLFSNGDEDDLAEACFYAKDAINTYEPRVEVLNVEAVKERGSNELVINMDIKVKKTEEEVSIEFALGENGGISWTI